MKRRNTQIIGWIYVLTTFTFIIFEIAIMIWNNTVVSEVDSILSNKIQLVLLIQLIAIIFFIISILFIFEFRINRAIIFGFLGSIIIPFTLYTIFANIREHLMDHPWPHPARDYYLTISDEYVIIFQFVFIALLISFFTINLVLFFLKRRKISAEESLIKRTVLDLGTKFTRLEVKEISEKCEIDRSTITEVIKEMIKKNEIYAEYFKSSNTVAFNQRANIDEIDTLMNQYKQWEEKEIGKK